MKNKLHLLSLKALIAISSLISSTVTAQDVKSDSVESEMYKNAIYGTVGISLELIGESWFTGTIYYERMFQKNAQKSNISTFVKAGYGRAEYWEGSSKYILGQFGILTGVKKHHLEASAGFVASLDEYYDLFPLSGSFGYRYQKPKGHFIFRTGLGYPEAVNFGLGVSF
jgi:hypothetical protein